MSDAQTIMAAVPLRRRRILIEDNQDVADIIRCITFYHKKHVPQYDQVIEAYSFDLGDERAIARRLYNFCQDHIDYEIETKENQTVRSPARILKEGRGDCKHYSSFIAGVLDALKRSGLDLDWAYRFSTYRNWLGQVNNHVFVVLTKPNGKEIWIDPVLNTFDYHLRYKSAITRTIDTMPKGRMGCLSGNALGCSCSMGAAGDLATTDRRLPVPAGYPTNIPFPVLTADGKLVLRNNWHMLKSTEIPWIQQALQPLIVQYSKTPYNIYWSLKGWGSGYGDILTASNSVFGTGMRDRDWLLYPKQPSGLDNILMSINDVLPTLVGLGANAVVPGSGGVASSVIAQQTADQAKGNSSTQLSAAQLQALQQQQSTQASIIPSLGGSKLFPLLLIAGGIYFFTKK